VLLMLRQAHPWSGASCGITAVTRSRIGVTIVASAGCWNGIASPTRRYSGLVGDCGSRARFQPISGASHSASLE